MENENVLGYESSLGRVLKIVALSTEKVNHLQQFVIIVDLVDAKVDKSIECPL
jgi:hypothetical protein